MTTMMMLAMAMALRATKLTMMVTTTMATSDKNVDGNGATSKGAMGYDDDNDGNG